MLTAVRLADQWTLIEENLPEDWDEVRLTLTTEQSAELERAAALLAPLGAGRSGDALVLHVRRSGAGANPAAARRLFGRLDGDRVWCRLEAGGVETSAPDAATIAGRDGRPLADQLDALLAELPADWSDALCEIEPASSAWLDRVALLCAPANPTRSRESRAFLFRCARRSGYGVSPAMARRCLERVDAEGMTGSVRVVRVLAETDAVGTQGPVFPIAGRVL
jgi:hypothetical protein